MFLERVLWKSITERSKCLTVERDGIIASARPDVTSIQHHIATARIRAGDFVVAVLGDRRQCEVASETVTAGERRDGRNVTRPAFRSGP